ncbi:NAD-dependent epimerase/dehydratase family protein [Natrinema amylolyticum]|uniref:NAD-dependent epimerase/dehydratase family protein n=1 Tax=Natrinema amylolyticum TaxID=2878679 RepID=UPI003CCCF1B2
MAEAVARRGHDVTVLDNFEPYYDLGIKDRNVDAGRTAAAESGATYKLVEGSITDAELVTDLVADTDIVYHQAAQAGDSNERRTAVKSQRVQRRRNDESP